MRARARKRFVSNERRSSIRLLEAVSSFTSGKKKQFWWENFYYSRLSLSSPPSQLIEQEVFFRNTLWDVTEVRNVAGSNEKYFFFKTIKKRCKRSTMQTLKSYSGAQLIERNRVPNSNVVGINDLDQNKKRKKNHSGTCTDRFSQNSAGSRINFRLICIGGREEQFEWRK